MERSGPSARPTVTQFEFESEAYDLPRFPDGRSPGRHSDPHLEGSLCRDNVQRRYACQNVPGIVNAIPGSGKIVRTRPESLFAFSPA